MTVKIPIKTRFKIMIRRVEIRLGSLLISIGRWFIRGCKPQPLLCVRNGLVTKMACSLSFHLLESWLSGIACTHNPYRLVRDLNLAVDMVGELASEVETLLQEVNKTHAVSEYTDGVETHKAEIPAEHDAFDLFVLERVRVLNLTYNNDMSYSTPEGAIVRFGLSNVSDSELLRELLSPKEVESE